jgi:CubicO group peptidase (beta-lactamase class C family)
MKKLIVCLLVLWPFIVSAQSTEQKITRIDSILTYLHERQLFNGTVLIGEKGKVLYKKAFGIANGQTQEKLTTLSSFNLASVSKQFYAMMVMLLKEQGKLHYEDPVQKYLPIFPYPLITIRHLMNQHTKKFRLVSNRVRNGNIAIPIIQRLLPLLKKCQVCHLMYSFKNILPCR